MKIRTESMKRVEFRDMATPNSAIFLKLLDPSATPEEVKGLREVVHGQISEMGLGMPDDEMIQQVDHYEESIPYEFEGQSSDIELLVVGPKGFKESGKKYPVIFHLHGGGLCLLHHKIDFKTNIVEVLKLDCVVVSPNYPLAPEHKYQECMYSLEMVVEWLLENGHKYNLDMDNVVAKGNSTGGHLAAALSHRLKDRNKNTDKKPYQFKAQILNWPILDDRAAYSSSTISAGGDWTPMHSFLSAKAWLGNDFGKFDLPGWAFPMRETDFKGLPATYIHTNELEHDRDACRAYMDHLLEANVFVEFKLWAGAHHAAQMFTDGPVSKRWKSEMRAQVIEAFTSDLSR
ncbi:alpha/beta hydrolase [Acidaminobacter sp. JC074]|uniref:alpha/beta hydrolase fold domain-containing protein n=1 Tax=Acidaminobacter sp. JC074 TaxID=2530199 RepID=UPI001F0F36D0|nr:alpha/beta hydrolase [Acidaminobacter sp. JC074]MCH4889416.1 alpha/beta hydrolase [Acidaminobacter sp. JC074]